MSICTNGNFDNIPPPIPVGLNSGRYIQQGTNVSFFNYIQSVNSNVSSIRGKNPGSAASYTYYIFKSHAEINSFNNGRMLLIQAYPNSNWAVVEQN
jgi:hypothetical protein